jgi:DNA-directed RNA polymerase specialized sigma24 family protein
LKPLPPESEDYSAANGTESPNHPASLPFSQPLTATEAPLNSVEGEVIDLYQDNASGLFRFAEALVRNREMAQDALQEVFLRYFVARSSGQEIQNGKAWLYRVTRNYLLDRMKEAAFKNKASLEEAEVIPDGSSDPEQQ